MCVVYTLNVVAFPEESVLSNMIGLLNFAFADTEIYYLNHAVARFPLQLVYVITPL